jgi:hypothetical protein
MVRFWVVLYGPTVRKTFWGDLLSRRRRNTTAWRRSRPCQARRTNGSPCCARAKRGRLYCHAHDTRPRQLWSLRPRQLGHRCKATSVGRTQNFASPSASNIAAGTEETRSLVPRYGAGVDVALNEKWSARVEYLFVDYANRDVTFPAAAEHFNSSLALQTIRMGLDYKLGDKAVDTDIFTKSIKALELDQFAFHGQTTFIEQYAAPFRSPYVGPHSVWPNQGRESLDFMYFIGVKA